jgi:hypothetical protein
MKKTAQRIIISNSEEHNRIIKGFIYAVSISGPIGHPFKIGAL